MMNDSLRVALISETLEAPTPQRRRAARMILDLIRAGRLSLMDDSRMAELRNEAGAAVAGEVQALLQEFGVHPARGTVVAV